MKAAAGDGQGQKTEHPLFEGVERTGEVKGDADGEQSNRQMHQIRVQRNGVGKIVGTQ